MNGKGYGVFAPKVGQALFAPRRRGQRVAFRHSSRHSFGVGEKNTFVRTRTGHVTLQTSVFTWERRNSDAEAQTAWRGRRIRKEQWCLSDTTPPALITL